jgi:hypothetical protein
MGFEGALPGMTTFVLGATDVHVGAALCDYLFERVGPDDVVHAVSSHRDDRADEADRRDGEDALNVVAVRLGAAVDVRTHRFARGNSPAEDLRRCADEVDADELVVGLRGGGGADPDVAGDATGPGQGGDVVSALLSTVDRPTVVVPVAPA